MYQRVIVCANLCWSDLVSAAFLASDYCYDIEMKRALEKHEKGEARVIPIIIRPIDWSGAPFSKLQALPKDAKPVSSWANRDEAWTDVAKGVRKAIGELPVYQIQEQKTEETKPAKAERRTEIELKQSEVKKAPKEEIKPAEKQKPTAPPYDRTGRFTGAAHNVTYNIQGKCFLEISKIAGQTASARFGFSEGLHAKGDLVGTINERHQLELVGIISSLQTGSFDCRIVCYFIDPDHIQGEYTLDPRAWNFLSSKQNGKLSLTRE